MRVHTFMKGALAGGVGATAALAATAAFAGTGVGGIFNLGQNNTVNGTSTLTGASSGAAQLKVTNTSTTPDSTGLSVNTAAGKPPLKVSNTTEVSRLNSQYVGGFANNELGRIAMSSSENLFGANTTNVLTSVSITAPKAGFVRLDGRTTAYDGFDGTKCTDCQVYLQVHDDTANTNSPISFIEGGKAPSVTSEQMSVSWVFPVTAGARTYSLRSSTLNFGGDGYELFNPVLVAQYVPFGGTGSATVLGGATTQAATPRARTIPTKGGRSG